MNNLITCKFCHSDLSSGKKRRNFDCSSCSRTFFDEEGYMVGDACPLCQSDMIEITSTIQHFCHNNVKVHIYGNEYYLFSQDNKYYAIHDIIFYDSPLEDVFWKHHSPITPLNLQTIIDQILKLQAFT